jgi:pilus assembly protein CpaF
MSDVHKAKSFLEASVLQPLLFQEDITDISYNGEALFYQSSIVGRKPSTITLPIDQAYHLIKQLANLMNLPFTYLDALVDMSIERYRIFAVGQAIGRKAYHPAITFAIRIHPPAGLITRRFITPGSYWEKLFKVLIQKEYSLVIAGKTGSGKTQFQKELLTLMPDYQRLIIIDNILELDGLTLPHIDITIWQVHHVLAIQKMIEGALRSNPDWLMIAESRGEEFKEVLRSVKTGHPIITTMHSDHIKGIYPRMISMLLMHEPASLTPQFLEEVQQAFPVIIQLKRQTVEGRIERSIAGMQLTKAGKSLSTDSTLTQSAYDDMVKLL